MREFIVCILQFRLSCNLNSISCNLDFIPCKFITMDFIPYTEKGWQDLGLRDEEGGVSRFAARSADLSRSFSISSLELLFEMHIPATYLYRTSFAYEISEQRSANYPLFVSVSMPRNRRSRWPFHALT